VISILSFIKNLLDLAACVPMHSAINHRPHQLFSYYPIAGCHRHGGLKCNNFHSTSGGMADRSLCLRKHLRKLFLVPSMFCSLNRRGIVQANLSISGVPFLCQGLHGKNGKEKAVARVSNISLGQASFLIPAFKLRTISAA
jgi:hypothetical protein